MKPKSDYSDIRAVVCDLDGTLLNGSSKVSDYTIETIKKLKEKGILFGICTGRPQGGIDRLLKRWKIGDLVDFVGCFNGGTIVDLKSGSSQKDHDLKPEALKKIMDHFEKYNPNFCSYQDQELWTLRPGISTYGMIHRNGLSLKKKSKDELAHDTQKLMITGTPWKISRILENEKAATEDYHLFRSGPFLIEILHPELNKFSGIEKICSLYDLKPEQIMSFGNDNNDLEMLEGTVGIAMSNALEPVKKVASAITDKSNREDGVAHFIEDHLLSKEKAQ